MKEDLNNFEELVEKQQIFKETEKAIEIVQHSYDCESGDDCVVMVNGNDGTFKRVFKNENGIILQPLNPSYSPIIYNNEQIETLPVKIIGIVEEIRRKKRKR